MTTPIDLILAERERQIEKFGVQNHRSEMQSPRLWKCLRAADPLAALRVEYDYETKRNTNTWPVILAEEFYEALYECTMPIDKEALRAELVQVAAVCVAWLESLDQD